jgi:hypothetical protein
MSVCRIVHSAIGCILSPHVIYSVCGSLCGLRSYSDTYVNFKVAGFATDY